MLNRGNESLIANPGPRSRSIAVVLAGGQSRRMGRDKLALAVSEHRDAVHLKGGPITILEHVVTVARNVADAVWLLTPPEKDALTGDDFKQEPNVRFLADNEFYQGPLAALARAWPRVVEASRADSSDESLFCVFVVAGDLPGLDPEVLRTCRDRLLHGTSSVDAVLTEREGMLQPLLGCYRTSAGRVFETAFANGDKRLLRAMQDLHVETVSSEGQGWSEWATRPVHTPQDYTEWLNTGMARISVQSRRGEQW